MKKIASIFLMICIVGYGAVIIDIDDKKALSAEPVPPFLSMPLLGYTPYDAPVSAIFDHSGLARYDCNREVVDFRGEVGEISNAIATCYRGADDTPLRLGLNYIHVTETGESYYLCYDGHPGTDYFVESNTPVVATADGIAHIPSTFPGAEDAQKFNTVEIDHQNGYKTYYLHLSSQDVIEDQQVYKGQIIGYSGDVGTSMPHLHFEVQKNGIPVDPYGWAGSGADPYTRAQNILLWE